MEQTTEFSVTIEIRNVTTKGDYTERQRFESLTDARDWLVAKVADEPPPPGTYHGDHDPCIAGCCATTEQRRAASWRVEP